MVGGGKAGGRGARGQRAAAIPQPQPAAAGLGLGNPVWEHGLPICCGCNSGPALHSHSWGDLKLMLL